MTGRHKSEQEQGLIANHGRVGLCSGMDKNPPEPEVEITPEMVEAGEGAVWTAASEPGFGEIGASFSPRDLAISVYRAMAALDRTKLDPLLRRKSLAL